MELAIRPIAERDVEFALALRSRESWITAFAWLDLMHVDASQDGFVAEANGYRIGTVSTACYDETAWIGSLIVSSEWRGRGVGTRLMERALVHIRSRGIATILLDADPPGIHIYRRLGFEAGDESKRFRLDAGPRVHRDALGAVAMDASDLSAIARLDREAFGDDRRILLGLLLERAEAAFIVRRGKDVTGYGLMLKTTRGMNIGPCIAESTDVGAKLIAAMMRAAKGRSITIGTPATNHEGCRLLASFGFRATPSSTRMVRGVLRHPGVPSQVFAIGSGAFG